MKERGNKCCIGHELDCVAILSALVSSMATKRPEMTPQETQVSQGWTFPRVPAALSNWLETTQGGVPLMVIRAPLCSQIHFSTRSSEQPIMLPKASLSEGVSGVKYSSLWGAWSWVTTDTCLLPSALKILFTLGCHLIWRWVWCTPNYQQWGLTLTSRSSSSLTAPDL